LITKNQYKIKITEIKGQSELKARENLFHSYQEKMKHISAGFDTLSGSIGKNLGQIASFEPQEKKELIDKTYDLLQKFLFYNDDFQKDLINELKKENLIDEEREKSIKYIKSKTESIINNKLLEDEKNDILFIMLKMEGIISDAKLDLLDKKSENLFKDYVLPKS